MTYKREEKLRLAKALCQSELGAFYKAMLEDAIASKESETESNALSANEKLLWVNMGVKIGLKQALNMPETIWKENEKYFDKLYAKVMGEYQQISSQ